MVPSLAAGFLMTKTPKANEGSALQEQFEKQNILKKYPVFFAGLVQLALRPFLLYAALKRGDYGLVVTALSWGAADIGVASSAPNLQKKKDAKTPAPYQA